jgi:WhiB family transcriptional regulator, redox-sensing transcriptional regulator
MSASWRGRAACLGADPDLFFPEGDDPRSDAEAKAICAGCQVRTPCLEFAGTELEHGIWGGLTEDERAADRRRQLRNARERAGRAAAA